MGERMRARLVMEEGRRNDVYPDDVLAIIDATVMLERPFLTAAELAARPDALRDTELLLTGWGAPVVDGALLDRAPRLRGVLHAAGSVKHMIAPEAWARGVTVVSAAAANADPVAEIAAAQIVLAARGVPAARRRYAQERNRSAAGAAVGAQGRTVGLVALGEIGRRVAERLRESGLRLIAADPFAHAGSAAQAGIELVDLEELFARADVVSLHAPLLPATTGMIDAGLLRRMPQGATLVNTARGGLVDEGDLVAVWRERPDLTALLDVTVDEPPVASSPLWTLENVELTPHVAGSMGEDRAAMGRLVAAELRRWAEGKPLRHRVDPASLDRIA